ncbi:MAG: hypothetical protein V7K40_23035 [Nostoc sp.]
MKQRALLPTALFLKETHSRLGILRQAIASPFERRGATRSEGFPQVEEPAVWC